MNDETRIILDKTPFAGKLASSFGPIHVHIWAKNANDAQTVLALHCEELRRQHKRRVEEREE